jgi:hypothetical protein
MTSSLVTAPSRFVEQIARTPRSGGVLMSMGLESDDVEELVRCGGSLMGAGVTS